MKNPFVKLVSEDFRRPPMREVLDAAEIRSMISNPTVPVEPKALSATAVGSIVIMLDKSYQKYLDRRAQLEAQIASAQEDLRQTNTIISSFEAALMVAGVDPALSTEEANIANAAADRRVQLDAVDLTPEAAGEMIAKSVDGLHEVHRTVAAKRRSGDE